MIKHLFFNVCFVLFTPILMAQASDNGKTPSPDKNTVATPKKAMANLVINPSFETPANEKIAMQPDNTIEAALGWNAPTKEESRLFTSPPPTDMVYDAYGSKWTFKARGGSNVAGLNVYGIRDDGEELREYIQGSLSEPLTVGKKYYFAFWVHYHCEGANNIGIAFLPRPLQIDSSSRLPLQPAAYQVNVNNYSKETTWSLVVDSFVAQRPFQNFIIGNFFSNDSTKLQSNNFGHHFAYIDDVFVMEARNNVMPENKKIISWRKNEEVFVPKVLNKVQFQFNSDVFLPESLSQLDEAALVIKSIPNVRILIKGFSSGDGDAKSNLKLSEKRAAAVRNYLIDKGVESSRLLSKGYGESVLLVTEDTEESRKKNRRVEFEILEK